MGNPVYFLDPEYHRTLAEELGAKGYDVSFVENKIVIESQTGATMSLELEATLPGFLFPTYISRIVDRQMERAIRAAVASNGGCPATKEHMTTLGEWTRSHPP